MCSVQDLGQQNIGGLWQASKATVLSENLEEKVKERDGNNRDKRLASSSLNTRESKCMWMAGLQFSHACVWHSCPWSSFH